MEEEKQKCPEDMRSLLAALAEHVTMHEGALNEPYGGVGPWRALPIREVVLRLAEREIGWDRE